MSAEEMLALSAASEVIPAPFTIDIGSARESGVYSLYHLSNGREVYSRMTFFEAPIHPGEYLCAMELAFGTARHYAGYQLYFRFSVA